MLIHQCVYLQLNQLKLKKISNTKNKSKKIYHLKKDT